MLGVFFCSVCVCRLAKGGDCIMYEISKRRESTRVRENCCTAASRRSVVSSCGALTLLIRGIFVPEPPQHRVRSEREVPWIIDFSISLLRAYLTFSAELCVCSAVNSQASASLSLRCHSGLFSCKSYVTVCHTARMDGKFFSSSFFPLSSIFPHLVVQCWIERCRKRSEFYFSYFFIDMK